MRTWATFSDVRWHGCYVEAQATYPAGTMLPITLEASGGRLETKGNGRVSYPYLGMGVPSWKCPKKTLDDCTRCWPRSHGPPRSWDRDSIPRCRPAAPGMQSHGSPIPPLPYRRSPNSSRPPDAAARRLPSHPSHQSEHAAIETFMVSPANATVSLGTTRCSNPLEVTAGIPPSVPPQVPSHL